MTTLGVYRVFAGEKGNTLWACFSSFTVAANTQVLDYGSLNQELASFLWSRLSLDF
jgi:hypothetical protein